MMITYLFSIEINEFERNLTKIITKVITLRDPSISVIHITPQNIHEAYIQFILIFKRLQEKYATWQYYTFNIEQTFFSILHKFRYTQKPYFVKTCEREELASDMSSSVKSELMRLFIFYSNSKN